MLFDAAETSHLPHARAHSRGTMDNGTPKRPQRRRLSKANARAIGQVAALKAEGLSNVQIARVLDTSRDSVRRVLALPETQAELVKCRELLKCQVITHVSEILDPAWALAKKAVEEGDTKSFENAMRGLVALEKIGQSVSGESQKVEHTGVVTVEKRSAVEELRLRDHDL